MWSFGGAILEDTLVSVVVNLCKALAMFRKYTCHVLVQGLAANEGVAIAFEAPQAATPHTITSSHVRR